MKKIKHSRIVDVVRHTRFFEQVNCPGAGFGFDCDADGNVNLPEEAVSNYRACIAGEFNVVDRGVVVERWSYREPAVGLCCCGREVELCGFTNTCDCGRDYNSAGQELAPREQWGEETGESLSDILMIP